MIPAKVFPWRQGKAAIAYYHRCDALAGFRRHLRVSEEITVVVGVNIDEARRHHLALGIDFPGRRHGAQIANRADPVARDRHIGRKAGRAAAIDHRAIADDEIGAGH